MKLKQVNEKYCRCSICQAGFMSMLEWEGGFLKKRNQMCTTTISNFDELASGKLREFKTHIGYGSLHLAKEGRRSQGFFQFNKLYDSESFLKDWDYLFTDLKWRKTFDESSSYAYVFNPQTREGQIIWGQGIPETCAEIF